MEIFELRYFLGVAATENIHQASVKLHVSPGSLSKAITRLEEELTVKLFRRVGRNIVLTDHGRLLQRRASAIVQLEEATKLDIVGHEGTLQVILCGAEILLAEMGLELAITIQKSVPQSQFEFQQADDRAALAKVIAGDAHLAIVTADVPAKLGLVSKKLGESRFNTYVGRDHPLWASAKAKRTVHIAEILKHPFVSPDSPCLGRVGPKQSLDGWRDDAFPRKLVYRTASLKILERLVVQGRALAYLPDYFSKGLDMVPLKVSGCPYFCSQQVKLVARNPKDLGWLNKIF